MRQHHHPLSGHALTEYAIVLALVVLAGMAGLSLLGDSVSKLLGGVGEGLLGGINVAEASFSGFMGGGSHGGGSSTFTADGPGASGGGTGMGVGQDNLTGIIYHTGGGGGINATSVDGQKQVAKTKSLLVSTAKLEAIADKLPDGDEKNFLLDDVIPRLRYLAEAQGYAAGIPTLKAGVVGPYTDPQAYQDILESRNELMVKMNSFDYIANGGTLVTFTPSPQFKALVQNILTQAIQGTSNFVSSSDQSASWSITLPNALDPQDPTNAYTKLTQTIQSAQSDGTIDASVPTATDATNADQLNSATP